MPPTSLCAESTSQQSFGSTSYSGIELLKHADTVGMPYSSESASKESIPQLFPSLFKGLGTFQQDYEIKLKPNVKPFA